MMNPMEKTRTVLNAGVDVQVPFAAWCEDNGYVVGVASEFLLAWYMAQDEDRRRIIHAEGGRLVSKLRADLRRDNMASRLPDSNASDAIVSGGRVRTKRKVRSS